MAVRKYERVSRKSVSIKNFPLFVSFICQIIFERYFIKAIEDFFRVSIASSKHSGKLGEFETVMQTLDCVSGLLTETQSRVSITVENFPNSPSCLDEIMETRKTSCIV